MKDSRRANLLLAFAVSLILGTLALYASLLYSWLADKPQVVAVAAPARPDAKELESARQAFRDAFLDPAAWLSLSETLNRAARPIDAFYVMQGARDFFGETAFLRAHEQVVLKREQGLGAPAAGDADEAALKTRLQTDPDNPAVIVALCAIYMRTGRGAEAHRALDLGLTAHPESRSLLLAKAQLTALTDPMQALQFYARLVHADPASYEGQRALEELGQAAAAREEGPRAEASRLAREALEELRKAHPTDPAVFSTLAFALWARGDLSTVRALALETERRYPKHAGVAAIQGALALQDKDTARAVKRFTAAWEGNPDDLYSAEKLAQIYDQQRADPEAALPFYIALYRRDPQRQEAGEPVEQIIRRTLDSRRRQVVKSATAEGLGRFLKSDDASLRAEACVRVAELKDPRWIEVLADLLDDDTEIVRHNADYALYQIAKAYPDAVQVRRDDWLSNNRPLLRARVLNLFADLWPQETWPLVQRALYDQTPALRYLVKTMVLDNYYKGVPAAAQVKAEYLAQEKNPFVLAQFDTDRRRAASRP
jgi:thioredoxin-like negative regulator of GroEL